jgi:diguanylate cyclase (GGDEF)-like protein
VAARGWNLERRMSRQRAKLAARIEAEAVMERRRSRILEDINAGQELADILEQITELVSFNLNGAPCWCQITDGLRYGKCPETLDKSQVIREELASRLGPLHGEIFAAIDPATAPDTSGLEALSLGARLAALAIETRSLYTDLIHRSEFDLLTDIHNRFSLDKRLETAIEAARSQSPVFGLIYIDLDRFKQVNDVYGHRVGDMYLQHAALRMKKQLRPGDMLARLGGDEFGVLVPMVRSRAEVQEIAMRLERCFDDPFAIEGYLLQSSASVGIALYPEDGNTKDSLLSAADAAMYVSKHTKAPARFYN